MAELAFDEDDDPIVQLDRLGGIKIEHLHQIIRLGEGGRRTSTPDDPINGPGSTDYIHRVRALRQVFRRELDWKRYELYGLPLVINADKTVAIGVLQGNAQTGVPGFPQPRSKKPVGEIKQCLIGLNYLQDSLFDVPARPDEIVLNDEEIKDLNTFFLMTRRVEDKHLDKVIIHSELSRAVGLDPRNYINLWKPRICMPPLEFDGVIDYIAGTDDGPGEYEVIVDER